MNYSFKTLAVAAIMSMVASLTASAYDFEADGLRYTILSEEEKTCEVAGHDETIGGDIVIPQQVNGYSVTAIGDGAFYYCHDLKGVVFPDNMTAIGNYAFFDSGLEGDVVFPKSLETIGESAFSGCNLTKVSLHENFTTIVRGAFSSCWSLREIAVSVDNPNFATYDGVLYNKDLSVLICCPGGKGTIDFSDNISQIGDYSFVGDSMKVLVLPQGVTSIGQYAFWNCRRLARVVIPESVTAIGEAAFRECDLSRACGCVNPRECQVYRFRSLRWL